MNSIINVVHMYRHYVKSEGRFFHDDPLHFMGGGRTKISVLSNYAKEAARSDLHIHIQIKQADILRRIKGFHLKIRSAVPHTLFRANM